MYKVNKLTFKEPEYPALLKHIPDAPKVLYVCGNIAALDFATGLSIVGSRKPSSYGRAVTASLTSKVSQRGVSIVSGLALGIDALAHQAALKEQANTVAVLPGGLDKVYPSSHQYLAEQIVMNGGALVSEYPAGVPPMKAHFIARNRIVSGLTNATLIIEAAEKSGTMHTANFALEQGRGVMAVPGPITSPASKGTNNLIAAGARIITGVNDIFDELGISDTPAQTSLLTNNEEELVIITLLQNGTITGKGLLNESRLEPRIFNQTMTMLELSGKIRPLGADTWGLQ